MISTERKQIIIFKVDFTYETSQYPQSPSNEIGNIDFYQEMTLDSFESICKLLTVSLPE